jgi:hypothetical protein
MWLECTPRSQFDPLQALAALLGSSEDLLTSRPSCRPYEHNQRRYDLHCRGQGERHHVARRNVPKHAEDSRSQRKDSLIERHHERDDRTDVGRTKLMLRDKRGKGTTLPTPRPNSTQPTSTTVGASEMIINATPTLWRRKFADAASLWPHRTF